VVGALLLAMTIADHPEMHDHADSVEPGEVAVLPPWEVSHPVLLDPIMWLVATAYYQA
jgi:hypothetical protein